MATQEDMEPFQERLTHEVESDEEIVFALDRFATVRWDEEIAPGRPEMTGQWRLIYWDFEQDREPIDRQKDDVQGAVEEARRRILKRLGETLSR